MNALLSFPCAAPQWVRTLECDVVFAYCNQNSEWQENDVDVSRHRFWFETEISQLPTRLDGWTTHAYRVHTSSDRYHLNLLGVINRHRDKLTIACAGIDTFQSDNPVSIALYAPPDTKENLGFVGSLAGSRGNYLRGDEASLLRREYPTIYGSSAERRSDWTNSLHTPSPMV